MQSKTKHQLTFDVCFFSPLLSQGNSINFKEEKENDNFSSDIVFPRLKKAFNHLTLFPTCQLSINN